MNSRLIFQKTDPLLWKCIIKPWHLTKSILSSSPLLLIPPNCGLLNSQKKKPPSHPDWKPCQVCQLWKSKLTNGEKNQKQEHMITIASRMFATRTTSNKITRGCGSSIVFIMRSSNKVMWLPCHNQKWPTQLRYLHESKPSQINVQSG